MTALMLISNNNKTRRREVGLSYAGINRSQVQRVSLSFKTNYRSTPSLYGCRVKLKESNADCKTTRRVSVITVIDTLRNKWFSQVYNECPYS
jgi:hypothetical protein